MPHTNLELSSGDVASIKYAVITFLDMDGAPSINISDGFRAHYGPSPFGLPHVLSFLSLNGITPGVQRIGEFRTHCSSI
jgi:hypothetical protein